MFELLLNCSFHYLSVRMSMCVSGRVVVRLFCLFVCVLCLFAFYLRIVVFDYLIVNMFVLLHCY